MNRNGTRQIGRTGLTILIAAAAGLAQVPSGYTITSFAGNGTQGFAGDAGDPTQANLAIPFSVVLDSSGNLYIADEGNNRIRKVSGGAITTIAGGGTQGYSGDAAAATSASLFNPAGVAVDSSGNVYIADTLNHVIRKVTTGGTISTVAGNNAAGPGFAGDTGDATQAQLDLPLSVAVDSAGNIYIADTGNNRIRKVGTDGKINTIVGSGEGYSGDGGLAKAALINGPRGITLDAQGNLYIADSRNYRVRKVTTDGKITTIAGNGNQGFSGDGGLAINASMNEPYGVTVDRNGLVYIAEYTNSRIRRVGPTGVITTIAGNGFFGYAGDGGPAAQARLKFPTGVAVDSSGAVYVADCQNHTIRKLTPIDTGSPLPAISAGGIITATAFGGFSTVAPGSWVEIYGTNLGVKTRSWNASDFRGSTAPTFLEGTSVTFAGQPAYVSYVSPTQLTVQVPSNVIAGPADVVVSTDQGSGKAMPVTVNTVEPGLFAPAQFKIGGTQYVGAILQDGSYVLPAGAVSGVNSRPARPGDIITLFGTGFGRVSPDVAAGQITGTVNSLVSPLQFVFGATTATVQYAGLAVGTVGLYQFNVVVPQVSGTGPLKITVGGAQGKQTLSIAVQ